MSARLEWRVGPDGGREALEAAAPETVVPRRSGRRLRLTPGFLGLYLVALVCAGWVGFGLGRWSESRSAMGAELARQLALETAAWRAADTDLLYGTLDPEAPSAWRAGLLEALATAAPMTLEAELVSFTVLGPDRVTATVHLMTPDGQRTEERLYRALGATWYRAPPD